MPAARTLLVLLLGLAAAPGCAARLPAGGRYAVTPRPDDWGPHPGAPMEWWYVSAASPECGLAFHAAYFRAACRDARPVGDGPLAWLLGALFPAPCSLAAVAVTELATGERTLHEVTGFPFGCAPPAGPPLRLRLDGWSLVERTPGGSFDLDAHGLRLTLTPLKPRTVHPPGWVGGPGLKHLAYQSVTRLTYEGTWRGRPVSGLAWMDHQWGDMIPGRDARWDWHGLHLSDGSDVMLFHLTRPDGSERRIYGSRTDAGGVTRALADLTLEPTSVWGGARGRRYAVGWRVQAAGVSLEIRPLWLRQEIASLSGVTYWEGPVTVQGTVEGRTVTGAGLGEHLPWPHGGRWAGPAPAARAAPRQPRRQSSR